MLSNYLHKAKPLLRSFLVTRPLCTMRWSKPTRSHLHLRAATLAHVSTRQLSSASASNSNPKPELEQSEELEESDKPSGGLEIHFYVTESKPIELTEVPELPELPPKPKKWPTPWVTEELANKYFKPLYELGWRIVFIKEENLPERKIAFLKRHFQFDDFSTAFLFMSQGVKAAIKGEHHDPEFMTIQLPNLSIYVQTHSALCPEWLAPPTDSTSPEQNIKDRTIPGITIRDIRFALLLEKAFRNADGRFLEKDGGMVEEVFDYKELEKNWAEWTVAGLKPSVEPKPRKREESDKEEGEKDYIGDCLSADAKSDFWERRLRLKDRWLEEENIRSEEETEDSEEENIRLEEEHNRIIR